MKKSSIERNHDRIIRFYIYIYRMFLENKYISFSRNKAVSNSLTFIFQLLECYYTRGGVEGDDISFSCLVKLEKRLSKKGHAIKKKVSDGRIQCVSAKLIPI